MAAKGNAAETSRLRQELREAVSADFVRRLHEMLTVEQRAAFDAAAAAEEQREAEQPKPQ